MEDTKITGLTEDTTPASTDLLITVDDPGGSPVNKKATIANVTRLKIDKAISATDKILGRATAGAGDVEEIPCTPFARTVLDDADAAAVLATLGAVATGDARLSDARAPTAHSHVKADVSDFPASMPASDVSAWAKAASKPSYTAAEVGTKKITAGSFMRDGGVPTVVAHGLGTTPTFVLVFFGNTIVLADEITSTTFRVNWGSVVLLTWIAVA